MKTRIAPLVLAATVMICMQAHSQTLWQWASNAATNWSVAASWTAGSGYPNALTDIASITNKTDSGTIQLSEAISLKDLLFTSKIGSPVVQGGSFIIADGGSVAITQTTGTGNNSTLTISSPMTFNGAVTVSNPNNGGSTYKKMMLSGNLTGSGSILVTNGITTAWSDPQYGGIGFSGNNTAWTGTMNVNNGPLLVTTSTGVGSLAAVNLRGGNVKVTGNVSGSTPFKAYGGGGLVPSRLWGMGVTLGFPIELLDSAIITLYAQDNNATFSKAISGTGTVKALMQPGRTVTLSGTDANTYSGDTFVARAKDYETTAGNCVLTLSKSASVTAIPGDLYIGGTTISRDRNHTISSPAATSNIVVQISANEQIADTSVLYIHNGSVARGGWLRLNGVTETVAGVASTTNTATSALIENMHATSAATLVLNVPANTNFLYKGNIGTLGGAFTISKWGAGTQEFLDVNLLYGNPTLSVTDGTLRVSGKIGNLTVNGANALCEVGAAATVATLNATNVTLSAGKVKMDLGDVINANNVVLTNGTLEIVGTPTENTYVLFNYTGSANIAGVTLSCSDAAYTLAAGGGTIVISKPLAPAIPSLPSPTNGTINVFSTATLSWLPSLRATSYDIYVWTGITPPAEPTAADLSSASYTPASPLSFSTTYKWKVIAKNTEGTTEGPEWSFTTKNNLPFTFDLTKPSDGKTSVTYTPTFTWQASVDATAYDLYLKKDGVFTNIAPDITATQYKLTESLPFDAIAYEWYVVAKNANGTTQSTSTFDFTTALPGSTYSWIGTPSNTFWTDEANWTDGNIPATPTDVVNVITNNVATHIDMEGNRTLAGLHFTQPNLGSFTFKGGTLTLGDKGAIDLNTISLISNNQTPLVSTPIVLTGDATFANYWSGGFGCRLAFSGSISGNGTLFIRGAKADPGYWGISLDGNNTNFVGTLCMTNNSSLRIFNNNTVTNVARFEVGAGIVQFLNSIYVFPAGLDVTGSMDLNLKPSVIFNTTIRLTNSATLRVFFDANGVGTATIKGVVQGTGNLEVDNSGTANACTLLLNGTNTYTGTTVVEAYRTLGGSTGIIPVNAKTITPKEVAPIVVQGTLDLSNGLKLDFANASETVVSSIPQVIVDYSAGTLNLGAMTMKDIITATSRWDLTNNTDEKKIYGNPRAKGTKIFFY